MGEKFSLKIDNKEEDKSGKIMPIVYWLLLIISMSMLIYIFATNEFANTDIKIITVILFVISFCFLITSGLVIESCPLHGLLYLLLSVGVDYTISWAINMEGMTFIDPTHIISLPMTLSIIPKLLTAIGYVGYIGYLEIK